MASTLSLVFTILLGHAACVNTHFTLSEYCSASLKWPGIIDIKTWSFFTFWITLLHIGLCLSFHVNEKVFFFFSMEDIQFMFHSSLHKMHKMFRWEVGRTAPVRWLRLSECRSTHGIQELGKENATGEQGRKSLHYLRSPCTLESKHHLAEWFVDRNLRPIDRQQLHIYDGISTNARTAWSIFVPGMMTSAGHCACPHFPHGRTACISYPSCVSICYSRPCACGATCMWECFPSRVRACHQFHCLIAVTVLRFFSLRRIGRLVWQPCDCAKTRLKGGDME